MAPARTKDEAQTRTGDVAVPREREKEQFVVRLQAQGGGLEESVTFNQGMPVTADQALLGLEGLRGKLSRGDLRTRDQAFERAAAFIGSVAAAGGTGPTSRSFTNRGVRGKDARVDVEVLRGVNLNKPPGK
jgi:hypothetical protein